MSHSVERIATMAAMLRRGAADTELGRFYRDVADALESILDWKARAEKAVARIAELEASLDNSRNYSAELLKLSNTNISHIAELEAALEKAEAALTKAKTDQTRPIVGIENRTPQEAFDIMCDFLFGTAQPSRQGQ